VEQVPSRIELTEYRPRPFEPCDIPETVAHALYQDYRNQVEVEPPSFKTDQKWRLTAQGWVGHIPVAPNLSFVLRAKTPVGNLFRMLEYAYQQELRLLGGRVDCCSLEEFYERLANVLAQRVLDRGRKGFYRAYVAESERLPFIRGRLDLSHLFRAPWDAKPLCHYHEHTADIEDNQILAWTLFGIARSGLCSERVLPTIRKAFRGLQTLVSLSPTGPGTCTGRSYHRLNEDYRPMHDLCRFFLEHSGPSHETGTRHMMPFLIDMERLYERFVAEWLRKNLPDELMLKAQERVGVDSAGTINYKIDLVLYDRLTGRPMSVLDTKYKTPDRPDDADINQVHTYAALKRCSEAILVYPAHPLRPLDTEIRDIRVRSLTFDLAGDLEQAGRAFLSNLVGGRKVAKGTAHVS
jgi:5-methylcytosine-specific restriction enzyme subunit McrC